ncbi:MAG: 3-deoxy-8-phosphooctulonate synthase, partial [Campylobacterales bacterium]|nr:3-deoxy-8-phosphooctulonate synthase [Campylobacterales bacterium]
MNKLFSTENLFVISGPCVIESRDMIMETAEIVKEIASRLGIDYIFKASFDKANRSSITSYRGPGLDEGLKILEEVGKAFDLPLTTDIHEPSQAKAIGEVVDIIQIPAFLCRQTDLLVESAKTGKIVNVKKAQFLSHEDMVHATNKVKDSGNSNIALTERGTMFGYGNLVVDFRNIIEMKKLGYPVIM